MDIRGGTNLSGVSVIDKYRVPNAPIIGVASTLNATVTVSYTAPSFNGNLPITSYTVVSNPGGVTATLNQSGSGTFTINGLTQGQSYTFTVYATNSLGNSASSQASNQITVESTESLYNTPGTYTWVAPANVTSVSVVCVGAGGHVYGGFDRSAGGCGGGGGGALAFKNNITVVPGQSYTVVVGASGQFSNGGDSSFTAGFGTVTAGGGLGKDFANRTQTGQLGGVPSGVYDGGGNGGKGGNGNAGMGGGGGAGGYSGDGGAGGNQSGNNFIGYTNNPGASGSGGAGGGGSSKYKGVYPATGGGVGVFGEGSNGAGGIVVTDNNPLANGGAGSNGVGVLYGAGGAAYNPTDNFLILGGSGAVRIIWPGNVRYFPSTRTATE